MERDQAVATPALAFKETLVEMSIDVDLLPPEEAGEVLVQVEPECVTLILPRCAGQFHVRADAGQPLYLYSVPALNEVQEEDATATLPNGAEIALPVIRLASADPVLAAHEAVGLIAYFNTVELLSR